MELFPISTCWYRENLTKFLSQLIPFPDRLLPCSFTFLNSSFNLSTSSYKWPSDLGNYITQASYSSLTPPFNLSDIDVFFSFFQLLRLSSSTRHFFSLFGPSPVSLSFLALAANLFTPRVPQAPNNYNLRLLDLAVVLGRVELEFGAVGFRCMYCGLLPRAGLWPLFGFSIDDVRASSSQKNIYPKFCNNPRCLRNRYNGDCRAAHIQTLVPTRLIQPRIIGSCVPYLRCNQPGVNNLGKWMV